MSPTIMLVLSVIAGSVLSGVTGMLVVGFFFRKRLKEAETRYQTLKRDFDTISAANMQLLRRHKTRHEEGDDPRTLQRFLELYDEAKRCLHRALDRHNATAPRPIVINRDGRNILEALSELPECSFSDTLGEDAGVRSWLRRVFELDMARRSSRAGPRTEDVLALEGERTLWGAALKQAVRA